MAPISNEFRVFEMELLAGEPSLETEVRENGARFRLDYRLVYWNSRLEGEHRRLVRRLLPAADLAADLAADPAYLAADPADLAADDRLADDRSADPAAAVVCDMFAGVGPFAVPVALGGGRVYANDLNPASARYLRHNAAANGVAGRVRISELDARYFVRRLLGPAAGAAAADDDDDDDDDNDDDDAAIAAAAAAAASDAAGAGAAAADLAAAAPLCFGPFGHVVMNLPATALDFLDVFVGAFDRGRWGGAPLPQLHCYCFSSAADPRADAVARAEAVLGCALPGAEATLVRDVAPGKMMLCLSFQLPDEVAWATGGDVREAEAQAEGAAGMGSGEGERNSQANPRRIDPALP